MVETVALVVEVVASMDLQSFASMDVELVALDLEVVALVDVEVVASMDAEAVASMDVELVALDVEVEGLDVAALAVALVAWPHSTHD